MSTDLSNQMLKLWQQRRNTILVLRHGHRQEMSRGSFGENLGLSSEGKNATQVLGSSLSAVPFGEIHASPILRCVQTAEAWLQGAEQDIKIYPSKVLGNPGAFVSDASQAGPLFLEHPLEHIAQLLVDGMACLPGLRPIEEGAELFVKYTLSVKRFPCLMITHDIVICLLCCYFFGSRDIRKYLPGFLQGFLMDCGSNEFSIFHGHEMKTLHLG